MGALEAIEGVELEAEGEEFVQDGGLEVVRKDVRGGRGFVIVV